MPDLLIRAIAEEEKVEFSSLYRGSGLGKYQDEDTATVGGVLHADSAAMKFHGSFDDVKAYARARFVPLVESPESFKYFFLRAVGNAGAMICDADTASRNIH